MTDEPEQDDDDSLPLRELHRLVGGVCLDCGRPYNAREAVGNIALGFKNAPRCRACISRRLGRTEAELQAQLIEYVQRRECYLKAWREAERMDGAGVGAVSREPTASAPVLNALAVGSRLPMDHEWNAGDLGCGELVMELRMRMNNLPPHAVIKVTATDPAAPEDIPAWCRLCGHTLTAMNHPDYFIRRKGD